jgi:alcohol dehydrogenase
VVCGTLVAEATEINIQKIMKTQGHLHPVLEKYARGGNLLAHELPTSVEEGCAQLVTCLRNWLAEFDVPRLGEYGITQTDLPRIIKTAGVKNNPVPLEAIEIEEIVRRRL